MNCRYRLEPIQLIAVEEVVPLDAAHVANDDVAQRTRTLGHHADCHDAFNVDAVHVESILELAEGEIRE
jgi:hypothetical protein